MRSSFPRPPRSRTLTFALVVPVLALFAGLPAVSAETQKSEPKAGKTEPAANPVLVEIEGRSITQSDVEKAGSADFQQLEREYAKSRRTLVENKLKEMVLDVMIEAEAKAKGVSPEKLVADATRIAPVTDDEVARLFEAKKAQIPPNITKEQVLPQIRQYLEKQRQNEARQAFYTALESRHPAVYRLEPVRVPVEAASYPAPALGPSNAPVTIVEFSDFQCPFCSRLKPTLEQVKQKYGDRVRIVFRQYPLASIHPHASKAAEAALCANDQGKFWEMHDAMFTDQAGLAVEALKAKATRIGLKAEPFNACLDSDRHAEEIQKDLVAGAAAGVDGTPAMFVNGRFIGQVVPFEEISKMIDDELKRSEKAAAKS